jgi:hypothetical protein
MLEFSNRGQDRRSAQRCRLADELGADGRARRYIVDTLILDPP